MMNKHLMTKLAILLVALTANTANAAYNVNKWCPVAKAGTKFPSFESCQNYYVCNGNGGYTEQSCSPGESFDKDAQACRPSSTVNCYYGVEDPCAQTTGTIYVPNPKNCHAYVYCKNKVQAGTGVCPNEQVFNGQSKACDYSVCTTTEGNTGIVEVGNPCEIMQTGAFFGDNDECNTWHKCVNGQMKNGTCDGSLVFNTAKGMCLTNDGTMCSRVENPAVIPTVPCDPSATGNLRGDENICSIYYKCDGTVWNKKTCTDNFYYDVNRQQCLARQTATPAKGCNRCQYATTTWVNSVDPDCSDYLTCSGGNKVASGDCGDDSYFSELRQGCIQGLGDLPRYRQNNGACYKSADVPTTTTTLAPDTTTTTTDVAGMPTTVGVPGGDTTATTVSDTSPTTTESPPTPETSTLPPTTTTVDPDSA